MQWIVDVYALMAGSLMLVCGSLADRLGRKRVFMAGLVLFTAASVAAAYAGSVGVLLVARGVMGVGEALIMPATLAVIGNVFPRGAERTKAIGIWSAAVGAWTVVGPLPGGWLLSHFWWGSVFLINLPIGIAGLFAAAALVPESRAAGQRRLDPAGALLSITAVASLLWAVIAGPTRGWTTPAVLTALAAAAVLAGAFLWWERRSAAPMLPMRIFRHRALAVGDLLILLGAFAVIGTLFVLVQHLQFVLGYSAGQTGLRLGSMVLALLIAGPLAGVLAPRVRGGLVPAVGLALVLAALAVLGTTDAGDGYGRALMAMVLLGAGAGFVTTSTSDAIVGALPEEDLGVGSATNSASIQLGAATGVAVTGSLLASRYQDELADGLRGTALPPGLLASAQDSLGTAFALARQLPGQAGESVAAVARHAFVAGMWPAVIAGIGVTAVGIVIALLFSPRTHRSQTADALHTSATHNKESS
ncbi:MFS transporter [Streptomyces canus]|uniref:MFS transporter n=1 Tax=Streptomyces canus TaxID=58343 RepID=UPI003820B205